MVHLAGEHWNSAGYCGSVSSFETTLTSAPKSHVTRPATIIFLAQRRKDAKKNQRNAAALCAFAREIFLA
jgi:hypothetical protein